MLSYTEAFLGLLLPSPLFTKATRVQYKAKTPGPYGIYTFNTSQTDYTSIKMWFNVNTSKSNRNKST